LTGQGSIEAYGPDAAAVDARDGGDYVAGRLEFDREAIAEVCRKFGVSRLAVFGSAVTDRFDPDHSDVDFLVEFRQDALASFKNYFGLQTELERLLGRPVDLVMSKALANPYFATRVEETREELFAG
jgi:predicted nucleotidyltransferase